MVALTSKLRNSTRNDAWDAADPIPWHLFWLNSSIIQQVPDLLSAVGDPR